MHSAIKQQYEEQGYALVSGLIPMEVIERAEEAMWRATEADPRDPTTWTKARPFAQTLEEPALALCYTPEVLTTAAMLAEEDPALFTPPTRVLALNVFPNPSAEWKMPQPHIDHAIKEHGHFTFPRAFRIATMLYLNDVGVHGGGTVVWPGSHKKIEALAKSDPVKYALMYDLNRDLDLAGIGEPLELTPQRGDVLFYHYLLAHAGSSNVSDRPRFAMNRKW
jgi:hypothetical protein